MNIVIVSVVCLKFSIFVLMVVFIVLVELFEFMF